MRVLVVHNRYRSGTPSGENRVVDQEVDALRVSGHEVVTYLRSSDEIDHMPAMKRLLGVPSPVHSAHAVRDIRRLIDEHHPDVLHLHNPYPLISMSVVTAAHQRGVPVVQTVHNHRRTCMKGTYQRDGRACHDCLAAGNPLPGVLHACYRGSRPQSLVMAAALTRGRRAAVDRYLALTPEISQSLVDSGVDPMRISVKPNSVPDPGEPDPPGRGAVFVGRLSREKGVMALIDAWSQRTASGDPLVIVGDGPARDQVRAAAALVPGVEVRGHQTAFEVANAISRSALVVVPSLWPEAFPLVLLESMAAGRALLVTDLGGLPGVVDNEVGLVVPPTVEGLRAGLDALLGDTDELRVRGSAARQRYLDRYHPDAVTAALVAVYDDVRSPV